MLVPGETDGGIVDIEPWDLQERIAKRTFDVAFAATGLTCLAPVCAIVALAIKLDGRVPVLYSQERTMVFGDTFAVWKFRSMTADAEAGTGVVISREDADGIDPHVTRIG